MRVVRTIRQMVLLLLLAVPAWEAGPALGQGMSVGGAALGGPDPLTSDPFAAAPGAFGVDDPAGDGPGFTGQDVLAVLDQARLGQDLPQGMRAGRVTLGPPSAFDRSLGGVGEARLELVIDGVDAAVAVWRAYADPGAAVAALPRLGASLGQELNSQGIGVTHGERDGAGFTCALARPRPEQLRVLCGLSVSLDPLQTLGVVNAALPQDGDPAPLIDQAVTIALWARDRWLAVENERRSG